MLRAALIPLASSMASTRSQGAKCLRRGSPSLAAHARRTLAGTIPASSHGAEHDPDRDDHENTEERRQPASTGHPASCAELSFSASLVAGLAKLGCEGTVEPASAEPDGT